MVRYIDADKIPYTDLNGDNPTSKVRVYVAFKERIDRVPAANVVNRSTYESVLEELCYVRNQLEREKQLVRDLITELGRRYEHN